MSIRYQHLKKKIGSSENTNNGNEVSYQRTRSDFPKYVKKHFLIRCILKEDLKYYEIKPLAENQNNRVAIFAVYGASNGFKLQNLNWRVITEIINETAATIYIPIYSSERIRNNGTKSNEVYIMEYYQSIREEMSCPSLIMLVDSIMAPSCMSFNKSIRKQGIEKPDEQIILSLPILLYPSGTLTYSTLNDFATTREGKKVLQQIIAMIKQVCGFVL